MSQKQDNISMWTNQWDNNNTPWHVAGLNPALIQYGEQFLGLPNIGTSILFPLCGKTVDMTLLAGKYKVAGIEGVSKALDEYAEINKSVMNKVEGSDIPPYEKFTVELPEVEAKPIVDLYLGDLFELNPADKVNRVQFDRVFDRGSIVAINPTLRSDYVKIINALLKTGSKWMFAAISYDQTKMQGPPNSLSPQMIIDLFDQLEKDTGAKYDIETLCDTPAQPTAKFLKQNGGRLEEYNDIVVVATKK